MAIIEIQRDRSAVRLAANSIGHADRDSVIPVKVKGWRRKVSHGPVRHFGYCRIDISNADHGNDKPFLAMELTKKKKVKIPVRAQWFNTRREAKEKAMSWLCESQGLLVQLPDSPGAIGAARQANMLAQLDRTTRRASWCVPVRIFSPEAQRGKVQMDSGSNVAAEPAQLPAQDALVSEATPEPNRAEPVPALAGDTLRGEGELKGIQSEIDRPESRIKGYWCRLSDALGRVVRAAWNMTVHLLRSARSSAVSTSK